MNTPDLPSCCRYLLWSNLLGRARPDGLVADGVRLEQRLREAVGCGAVARLSRKTVRAITEVSSLGTRSLPLMALLLRHVPALANDGPLALVLDDLGDLRRDDLVPCAHLVERLLHRGVLVLVLEAPGQLTSLTAVGEVVTTGDFVHLYLNDLWHATRSIRKAPRRVAAEMDAECVI